MIAKMDKLSFLVYHKEYEGFLDRLRELGVVHVEIRQSGEVDDTLQALLQELSSYKALLKEMEALVADSDASSKGAKSDAAAVAATFHELKEEWQALTQKLPALEKDIAMMQIWGEFDWAKVNGLKDNGWNMRFFSCPERNFNDEWIESFNAMPVNHVGGICYFVTMTETDQIDIEAESVRLPSESLSSLTAERVNLLGSIDAAYAKMTEYAKEGISSIRKEISRLKGDVDLRKVKLGGEKRADGALILLEGWVPDENLASLRDMLDKSGIYYEYRPAEMEDDAPIKLKNNKITSFFETLTKMYGMPDYGEFDPTPLLAPFYALFFGLCLGDAGYGLFLVLLGLFLKTKVSKSMAGMMNLLITLGAAATVVGALVGTFFGVELAKLEALESVKQFMIVGKFDGTAYDKTMIFALIVGMVHICFAMTVKAIGSTVRYGFLNSLSAWGWLLFVGGSVTVGTLTYLGKMSMETMELALMVIGGVSALGIYLFNNIRRNIFMNVGAGLWDTYNMATGLMGDLLSYLRLYALGLAGGMLGGVFNSLGMQLRDSMSDFMWGIPGWIAFGLIFVFGHALNIALSCLSAYVHSIRLTFVEYFKNSGYDGKGTMYKPFSSIKDE